ncbi:MAG TPA: GDP-mannose 4,6-dehydratase [Nocardioides sp.]|uniref:GDP-mannose 4,6-dehydratase n=1 Tax=Nocardioides sp. TaxID=35761 RepID=UPI002E31CCD4|nr:GDP-mannose 4,6-dehydratase [Nocardioides sp.]HEX5089566.1 GDP-mannose 4,6-dehydratase [Nocardioides sp.]
MPTALITGVGGQDGGYLAERLLADGVEVHALALPGDDVGIDGVHLHTGDVADLDATRASILEVAPDEVYNLAGLSSVARSWDEPGLTARVNGLAAAGLMGAAHDVGARFVQASSAEIFGLPDRSPQDEDTPVRPANPYGAAKAYAHFMVEVYRRRGLHGTSLVLYNHESPRRPAHFVTRKISSGVAAIAAGHAGRISLGNLAARRDWGWAPDYVEAMVLAARATTPRDYVVATGEAHSVEEFAAAAFGCIGIADWSSYVDVDPALIRPVDAPALVGDASRIREELGWQPTVDFGELVRRMVEADRLLLETATPPG